MEKQQFFVKDMLPFLG